LEEDRRARRLVSAGVGCGGELRRGLEQRARGGCGDGHLDLLLERGRARARRLAGPLLRLREARERAVEDLALGAQDRELTPLARIGLALEQTPDLRRVRP